MNGILIGRILIKQGVATPIEVQTAFDTIFNPAQATDHGNLAGLGDDDHPQYGQLADAETIAGAGTGYGYGNGYGDGYGYGNGHGNGYGNGYGDGYGYGYGYGTGTGDGNA